MAKEAQFYDLGDGEDPASDIPPDLPVDTIIRQRGEILGWWNGSELRPVHVGIYAGPEEGIIYDPTRGLDPPG